MIITISRQFGAGGSEVARAVATELGWSLVDNQLIDEVAARAGLARDEVAQHDERAPGFAERLARTLATSVPEFVAPEGGILPDPTEENLVKVTETVVADLAAQGQVVMVGRAAPAVLATHPDALHVQLVAPKPFRIARAAERLGVDPHQAEKILDDTDGNRARYLRKYYKRDWRDPANYHIVLNTEALGLDGAAEVIVGRARRTWMKAASRP